MATLVLTTIGGAIGGPVGALIGTAVGGVIDREVLFKPKGREGPRLTELKLQTSSYGTPIQQVFGTMRVAGCVIWATDLIESRSKGSAGKGQPTTTTYSYSASFAVALSGRSVADIGRIWADGKLLRGAGGDFKVATGFRLHTGGEDQAIDPLIASAEGAGLTPAHRGIAYAVFDQLQLADYGNRIPSLTFEVIADAAPVAVGAIAAALSDGAVDGSAATQPLAGFAAYGASVRGVLETLAVAGGAWFAPDGAGLRMRAGAVPHGIIADGAVLDQASHTPRHGRAVAALETVPRLVTLAHYDPARDYQTGLQRARRPGAGAREDRVEMPAAIDADTARTLAQAVLERAEAGRERRTVALGWDALDVAPGAVVTIRDVAGTWRVSGWSFEHGVLALECVRLAAATLGTTGSTGRALAAPDLATGATLLAVFEGLPLDDTPLAAPRLTVIAAGTSPGWRRAALLYSTDGGARWIPAGATAAPGTLGTIAVPPGRAGVAILDLSTTFEVDLTHAEMALSGADDAALAAGANLALAGDELLQFGVAEQIGATRWRLGRLARGRRGTEAAVGLQTVGDRFVLVEPDAAVSIDLPPATLGTDVRVLASGSGDVDGPVAASVRVSGASVLPPGPVHLTPEEIGDGDVVLRWVRRSRVGWRWIDAAESPLGEERELYRLTLTRADGAARTIETTEPMLRIARSDRLGGVTVAVRQAGLLGESPAATCSIVPWTTGGA